LRAGICRPGMHRSFPWRGKEQEAGRKRDRW
jgi:hypothetical protein